MDAEIKYLYDLFERQLKYNMLPSEVRISTMTVICSVKGIEFNCSNIVKYIKLDKEGIMCVSGRIFKNGEECNEIKEEEIRTTNSDEDNEDYYPVEVVTKVVKTTKRPTTKITRVVREDYELNGKKVINKNVFLNQVSMRVQSQFKDDGKAVNVKLFSNGSIQMTGCKSIDIIVDILITVFDELKRDMVVLDFNEKKIVPKPFVSNKENLTFFNIVNAKIVMINSNFSVPFNINREKLYILLMEDQYSCVYDCVKHAGVKIKYICSDQVSVSILVFDKGAIIITGASDCNQIYEAYKFINEYLLVNINTITKYDIDKLIRETVPEAITYDF